MRALATVYTIKCLVCALWHRWRLAVTTGVYNGLRGNAEMSLVIDLAPEVEKRLRAEASERGMPPAELARGFIESGLKAWPKNGAELVEYWERAGVIGSRPDITDSLEHARDLRRRAEIRECE